MSPPTEPDIADAFLAALWPAVGVKAAEPVTLNSIMEGLGRLSRLPREPLTLTTAEFRALQAHLPAPPEFGAPRSSPFGVRIVVDDGAVGTLRERIERAS